MTNSKHTKRALLASILSVVLCCAMLIGSTFAWFTDSVTSGNNKIVAGNLGVELEYRDQAGSWKPVTETTKLFQEDALWEPGHTEVVYLRVKNAGNLALKYQLAVTAENETTFTNALGKEGCRLSDYLVFGQVESDTEIAKYATREDAWAAAGDTLGLSDYTKESELYPEEIDGKPSEQYIALVVYMPAEVGNEANYRGDVIPSIDLGVNLVATQYTYETDSFDDQYDKDAGFSIEVPDGTAASLQKALYAAKENDTVILTQNTSTTENLSINRSEDQQLQDQSIFIDLNKNTFTTANSSGFGLILRAGSATISNGKMSTNNADGAFGVLATSGGEALYLNDLEIENFKNNGVAVDVRSKTYTKLSDVTIHSQNGGGFTTYGTADLYDCTMTQTGYHNWNSNNVSVSNGGTVNVHSGNYTSGNYGLYIYNSGGTFNVYDGTFTADRAVLKADYNTGSSTINVYGGSFDGKIEIASGAKLNILEGTFTNTGLTLDQFKVYVAEGSAVTEADGIFTVIR